MYYRTDRIQTRGCIYIDFNILYLRCCDPCEITSQQFSTYVLYVRVRERVPCTNPFLPPPFNSHLFHLSMYISLSLFSILSLSQNLYRSPLRSISIDIPIQPIFDSSPFFSFSCPSEWSLRECVSPCLSLELFALHAD